MSKIGIALGGGGARGLAHIGVLRVLERHKVPLDCIAGTSMGAIVGACYAVEPNVEAVEQRLNRAMSSPLFSKMKFDYLKETKPESKKSFLRKAQEFVKNGYLLFVEKTQDALLDLEVMEQVLSILLPDIKISQTKVPFTCVATDLTEGKKKIFTEGSLRKCVLASASIPGVFPPVKIDGVYYSDGGAVSSTPVDAAQRMGAGFIIASDVKGKIVRCDKPEKASEIMSRCNYITGMLLNEVQLQNASVVISPDVKYFHWTDFDRIGLLVQKGEDAAQHKILEIKAKTKYRTLREKLLGLFGLGKVRQSSAGGIDV